MREAAVVLLSYLVVAVASLFAYSAWLTTWLLEPFWRGVVSVLFWILGFALGARLFWNGVKRLQGGRRAD